MVRVVLKAQTVLVVLGSPVDQFLQMVLHFQRLPEVLQVLQVLEDQRILFHPLGPMVPVVLYRLLPLEDLLVLSVQVVPGTLADPMVLRVPMDPDCLCHQLDLAVPMGPGSRLGPWVQKDQDHRLGLCRPLDHWDQVVRQILAGLMVQWDPRVLVVLMAPKVLEVQMVPEDQVPQVDLEVPGTRPVPEGHFGPLVLGLRKPHFRPGHHHFLLVRSHLEVQEIQVFQLVPVTLRDLEVQPDWILVFPVDLRVQAVPTDRMDQCHLGVQRDQGALPIQKDLMVLVVRMVLVVLMVLEIQETLYRPEVLATQMVLQVLSSQTDPVAQVGNREVRWFQRDQADRKAQGNQADPKVLDLLVLLVVRMVPIGLLDQKVLFLLWFPSIQCLLVVRLVLLVPETRVVPVDPALPRSHLVLLVLMVPAHRSDRLVLRVQGVPQVQVGPDFRHHHFAHFGLHFRQVLEVQVVLGNLNFPMVRGHRRDQTNQVRLVDRESRRVLVDQGFQLLLTDLVVLWGQVVLEGLLAPLGLETQSRPGRHLPPCHLYFPEIPSILLLL